MKHAIGSRLIYNFPGSDWQGKTMVVVPAPPETVGHGSSDMPEKYWVLFDDPDARAGSHGGKFWFYYDTHDEYILFDPT